MIVVDSSAVMAILLNEPDGTAFAAALLSQPAMMGAPTLVECGRVAAGRFGSQGLDQLDVLLNDARIWVTPFEDRHAKIAIGALQKYGRGSGHRANLNFGDCMAYAIAKQMDAPLLFKGDDFIHTDVVSAMPFGAR